MLLFISLSQSTFSLDRTLTLPTELLSAIRTFLLSKPDFIKQVNKESPPRGKLDAQIAEWAVKLIQKRETEYLTSIEVSYPPFPFLRRS